MLTTRITDYSEPIHEYRSRVASAMDDLMTQLRKIETQFTNLNSFDVLEQVKDKYDGIIDKTKELEEMMNDYDNILYELEWKLREFEEFSIRTTPLD